MVIGGSFLLLFVEFCWVPLERGLKNDAMPILSLFLEDDLAFFFRGAPLPLPLIAAFLLSCSTCFVEG